MIDKVKEIRETLINAFSKLEFNEKSHTYKLNGNILPSVSSLLKKFTDPFDSKISINYANKNNFELNDVISAWGGEGDIANDTGHRVHTFGEDYVNWKYFNIGKKPKVTCKKCLGIVQFWNDLPDRYVPVYVELRMFSENYKYAGTADIICYDTKTNKLIILDYKTNKELFDSYNKKILHLDLPLNQDNFSKYTLQFNFYQILLEDIGFEIGDRILIWLSQQENGKLYKTYKTINTNSEIRKFLENN